MTERTSPQKATELEDLAFHPDDPFRGMRSDPIITCYLCSHYDYYGIRVHCGNCGIKHRFVKWEQAFVCPDMNLSIPAYDYLHAETEDAWENQRKQRMEGTV
jgi:hypothetical protein